jgi:hypothetical protein
MKQRVVFINVLILAGVMILAWGFRSSWKGFEQENNLEGIIESAMQEEGGLSPSGVEPIGQPGAFSGFLVIADRTLFAENRRPESEEEVVEEPTEIVEETPPPKWSFRPKLHGVFVVRGKRQGVMTVFEGDPKGGEARNVGVGDLVQGYWVDEIGETIVRLRWGSHEEIIDMEPLTAAGQPARGTVTVITVGSAPTAVQTTAAVQQQGSGLEVSVVGGSSGEGATSQAGTSQVGGALRQGSQAAQPATDRNPGYDGSIP